jgi:glycine cleavage system H protein
MNFPKELKYSKTHEWVKIDGTNAEIGISDYAQNELGDIVFVDLPEVDDEMNLGERLADIESVKAVSEVYSPVSGKVTEINESLLDSPQLINESPYDSWFIKVSDITETADLMDSEEYADFIEQSKKK